MNYLGVLLNRTKQVRRTEGLMPLLRSGFAFALSRLFEYKTYYVYGQLLEEVRGVNEADLMPEVDNLTFRMVSSNREADELEAEGFEFRSQTVNARKGLDNGGVAFCIFIGRELAHIGWVAMTQRAKDSLGELPYRVDFSMNEACGTGLWTNPKYRRMGLYSYNTYKRRQYMVDNGARLVRSVVEKRNAGSQSALANVVTRLSGEARHLRVLWWKSWKERPLAEG